MSEWPFPDRPGVPLNPQQPGKHWLRSPEGELCLSVWFVTDNPKYSFWEKGPGWSSPAAIARTGWTYHGPCLTPAEIAAKDAEIARLRATINQIMTPGDNYKRLSAALAAARLEGMEEAAKKADAIAYRNRVELPEKWKDRPGGIPKDWTDSWEVCAETADNIAADIRAAAKEVKP